MVTLSRKAANEHPASTAALRRVATSLSNQRRALRHPAGALIKKSSAEETKRIREEVMNGTFTQWAASSRTKTIAKGVAIGLMTAALAAAAHSAPLIKTAHEERAVEAKPNIDHARIENLQRWVTAGHEEWCKDARLVAMDELRRAAPVFAGDAADLDAVPMDQEAASENRAVFAWSSPDGRATYRVTVEKFDWLLPIAGEKDAIVWVPTHVEIVSHR